MARVSEWSPRGTGVKLSRIIVLFEQPWISTWVIHQWHDNPRWLYFWWQLNYAKYEISMSFWNVHADSVNHAECAIREVYSSACNKTWKFCVDKLNCPYFHRSWQFIPQCTWLITKFPYRIYRIYTITICSHNYEYHCSLKGNIMNQLTHI